MVILGDNKTYHAFLYTPSSPSLPGILPLLLGSD